MYPYFIILVIAIFLAFVGDNVRLKYKTYKFDGVIILILLALFSGFRDVQVGSDTNMYANRFERQYLSFLELMTQNTRIEIGYRFLEYIASLFSHQYVSILLITAFVVLFFQLKGIYKLSEQKAISLFVFITFGIYTYMFNGARQALSAAVFVYAITFLIQGNFKKYAFWVLIAFFFHKSALFGIPLYFLFRIKFSTKILLFLGMATIVVIAFFNVFIGYMSLLSEQYAKYQDIEAQGGAYLTLAFSLLSSFFIIIRPKLKVKFKREYDIYLNMFLFGTMIFVIVFFSGAYIEMTRLAFYYTLSAMFIWPLIFKSLQQKEIALVFVFFMIVHIFFFYIFIGKMANLNPYIVNPQIFNLLQ
ncbi:EpsG family protein [Lutibacter sp.]